MIPHLHGRVAVVTGAGRGIGRAIATELAAAGMSLLLAARTGADVRELAEELAERYRTPCLPAAIDVTDRGAVDRVIMHTEQQLGAIDLLVNSAGAIESAARPFWLADPDELLDVVATNLLGPLIMTRAVLPAMVARRRGHVVTLASRALAAQRTGHYTAYAVSKSAASRLTERLAVEVAGTGVVLLDVLPGLVRTSMTESMPVWAEVTDWDDPAAAAALIVEIAGGRHDARTGTTLAAGRRAD